MQVLTSIYVTVEVTWNTPRHKCAQAGLHARAHWKKTNTPTHTRTRKDIRIHGSAWRMNGSMEDGWKGGWPDACTCCIRRVDGSIIYIKRTFLCNAHFVEDLQLRWWSPQFFHLGYSWHARWASEGRESSKPHFIRNFLQVLSENL